MIRKKEYEKTYNGDRLKEFIEGAIKAIYDEDDLTIKEYEELKELFKR